MSREEVLRELRELGLPWRDDRESNHLRADELLLEYIADSDVSDAYKAVKKWYA